MTGVSRVGVLTARPAIACAGQPVLARRGRRIRSAWRRRSTGATMFSRTDILPNMASPMRSPGRKATPARVVRARRAQRDSLAAHQHPARARRRGRRAPAGTRAARCPRRRRGRRSGRAAPRARRCVNFGPESSSTSSSGCGVGADAAEALSGKRGLERAADDQLDDLVLGVVGDDAAADDLAVAQDGQVGGDLDDLGDAVGDVDDRRRPASSSSAMRSNSQRGLLGAERLGRLVEHQDRGVGCQRGRDLDEVRLAQRQGRDRRGRIDAQTELLEVRGQPGGRAAALRALRLGQQQQHRVEHGERGRERGHLVDDRQAALARRPRLDAGELLAREADRARIGHDRPRGDSDERRLARPVLSQDRVDLPTRHGDAHVIQGAHTGVGLGDPGQNQGGVSHRRRSSRVSRRERRSRQRSAASTAWRRPVRRAGRPRPG